MMVTVTMATTRERRAYAERAIASLRPQADVIRVYLNDAHGDDLPGADVTWKAPQGDLADNGKFYDPPMGSGYGWHFTVDDDLLYPPTYCADMIACGERYLNCAIITLHGSIVTNGIASYYRDRTQKRHCLGLVAEDTRVNIPGSGAACWHTGSFAIDAANCTIPYMADIWLGRKAQEQQVPIVVMAHTDKYLRYQAIPTEDTIWGQFSGNDRIQTWLVNRTEWEVL